MSNIPKFNDIYCDLQISSSLIYTLYHIESRRSQISTMFVETYKYFKFNPYLIDMYHHLTKMLKQRIRNPMELRHSQISTMFTYKYLKFNSYLIDTRHHLTKMQTQSIRNKIYERYKIVNTFNKLLVNLQEAQQTTYCLSIVQNIILLNKP